MSMFVELPNFSVQESWGHPAKMNGALLLTLQALRTYIDKPFVIHCAYDTKGHSESSQHYIGNAVDFHIVGLTFAEAILEIEEAITYLQLRDFIGLGIYPDWNSPGFHLDLRGTKARWGRLGASNYVAYETARAKVI